MLSFIKPTGHKKWLLPCLFFALALIFSIQGIITHRYNNFLIFKHTFWHLINQQNLYAPYPDKYFDVNHYGPIFGLIMAPFALLPEKMALMVWNIFNTSLLFFAIKTLPLSNKNKNLICILTIPCMVASLLSEQYNPAAAALIIMSFTFLNKEKGFWSALFVMLGTFIKLYGIVGLAFFFFVKDKKRFILYCLLWAVVLFLFPMLFTSPQYILNSYMDWGKELIIKNRENILSMDQDISVMGFFRVLLNNNSIPNLAFLILGGTIFLFPYIHISRYGKTAFQLNVLASVLFFTVLFSTGAEDVTYIISSVGIGIWFIQEENSKIRSVLLSFLMIGLFKIYEIIIPASLAVARPLMEELYCLPFFIIWLRLIYSTTLIPALIQETVLTKKAPESIH